MQFQFTIRRMLLAITLVAASMALWVYTAHLKPKDSSWLILLLLAGASGAMCAAPGALANRALRWFVAGFALILILFGLILSVKLVLIHGFGIGA
jgi:hypothetical protein